MTTEHIQTIVSRSRQAHPELPPADVLAPLRWSEAAEGDPHAETRELLCQFLNQDLQERDRPLLRYVLTQEIAFIRASEWGTSDALAHACWLLCRLGQVEDSLLIWQAKNLNFDTHAGVDVQMVAGAGLEPTLAYLRAQPGPDAADAVDYLEKCREAGDFDELDSWRQGIEGYFTP